MEWVKRSQTLCGGTCRSRVSKRKILIVINMAFREDKLLDNIDGCSLALIKNYSTIVSVVIPRWWWEESTRQFVDTI